MIEKRKWIWLLVMLLGKRHVVDGEGCRTIGYSWRGRYYILSHSELGAK